MEFFNLLAQQMRNIHKLSKSPLVHETLIKIIYEFLKKTALLMEDTKEYTEFVKEFNSYAKEFIDKNIYGLKYFRFKEDLGHSVLRIALVKLAIGRFLFLFRHFE